VNTTAKHTLVETLVLINHQNPKSPNWGLDAFSCFVHQSTRTCHDPS
jgi:hypothetical protein